MAIECLGLELTDRCDLACAHCLRAVVPPSSPRARDIPLALARRLIGEAVALGIPHVGLTGGEPRLHPQFLDIVDSAIEAGMTYHFLSNGLGLPGFLPSWAAVPARREKLRDVCISIDGATAATHDRIRGTGTFKRALAGIAVLRAMGVRFTMLHTITRVSRGDIDQMGLLAHHLGAERLIFCHFLPNGRPGASADLDLSAAERHEVEFTVKRLMHAMRFEIAMAEGYYTTEVDHMCATVALRSLNVDPSGHLTFCCELSNFYGDARPADTRSDFICDLAVTPLADAARAMSASVDRFRALRLADAAAARFGEDDKFACRYCVRHFEKPEVPVSSLVRHRRGAAAT